MRFLALGPLEVLSDDGALQLGGRKQRLVLVHLLVRANHSVPADVLIDQVWGEEPPDAARSSLQAYVSHLRGVMGEGRIESAAGGYVLRVRTGEYDAEAFEMLASEARGGIETDPGPAAAGLQEALALWRGPAFGDLSDELSLQGEVARLTELKLLTTEERISAELALGRHSRLVGELEALTIANPLRERLWGMRMLALYRSGRQGEALAVFDEARKMLAEQLGIDPSRSLRRLHERILAQDPALSAASRLPDSPVPSPQPRTGELGPGMRVGLYKIRSILGRGGMSVVYLAEHEGLKRNVALKVLAPQLIEDERFRDRFVRESQLAASLDHPNVIPIYEAGEADGHLFIAMRYVDGTDLRELLRTSGPLDPARVLGILRQTADALDSAHVRGLVHRDVKPGNILIARRAGSEQAEQVYLSDFGLTKRASSLSGLTGTGQFIGTLDYAAPEQFQAKPLDARTDVYSLGAVLYECLAGRPPFPRDNDAAVMHAHLSESPPDVTAAHPELPGTIDEVVRKAMAKDPADRYQTAGELAAAAGEALAPAAAAELLTFLIADVRGYTTYTREHGDEAGADLARAFAEISREVVESHDGTLLELRGDEALAVFVSARQALRSAIALQDRFRESGLARGVGIGLDAGEAVPVGGGYRGTALNLAARLCSQAKPGQVIASETVTHLAARVDGLEYVDSRTIKLKGFEAPVRAVDVVGERPPTDGSRARRPRFPRSTRAKAMLAGALAVAIAIGAGVVQLTQGGAGPSSSPAPPTGGITSRFFTLQRRPYNALEMALLEHVPGGFRKNCSPAVRDAEYYARGDVVCVTGQIEVDYSLHQSADLMNLAYSHAATSVHAGAGDCAIDHLASGPYYIGGRQAGRVLCFQQAGASRIAWTDDHGLILSTAVRSDLGDLPLYDWWANAAGPTAGAGSSVALKDTPAQPAPRLADGTFIMSVSSRDASRLGATQAKGPNGWAGVWALKLDSGTYGISQDGTAVETGTYVPSKGRELEFTAATGRCASPTIPTAYGWSLSTKRLIWTTEGGGGCAGPQPLVVHPWVAGPEGEIVYSGGTLGSSATKLSVMKDGFETIRFPLGGDNLTPAWSPDGSKIVFSRSATNSPPYYLYVMNLDGTSLTELTSGSVFDVFPDWSPDGSKIAFERDLPGGKIELDVINADGSGLYQLARGTGNRIGQAGEWRPGHAQLGAPDWSPDGTKIAFDAPTPGPDPGAEVFVVNADGSGLHGLARSRDQSVSTARWSPDGSSIAFALDRGRGSDLYVIRADGSAMTMIPNTHDANHPTWSPDGTRIVYARRTELIDSFKWDLYLVNVDGSGLVRLTSDHNSFDPAWRQD